MEQMFDNAGDNNFLNSMIGSANLFNYITGFYLRFGGVAKMDEDASYPTSNIAYNYNDDTFNICVYHLSNDDIWYSIRDVHRLLNYETPNTFYPKYDNDKWFYSKSYDNDIIDDINLKDHTRLVCIVDVDIIFSEQLALKILDRIELVDDEITRRVNWLRRSIKELKHNHLTEEVK